jgi:predicted dehydrogenase
MQENVKLVVVGAGLVGKRHVDVIHQSRGAALMAIVEPNAQGAAYAAKHDVPHFPTLDEMFAQMAPDGVILATPTPLHVKQGLACVARGCAVLVEKPLATCVREAQQLTREAERQAVPILVGHHRRHNPLIQAAARVIQAGEIGEIRAVQATCWFYKPDDYFDAAPWRKQKGAGPISVNLVHDVDLLRAFCGEVTRVYAQASPARRGYENEDVATALLTFENGAIGTITVSDAIVAPWSWELTSAEYPIYPVTDRSCYMIGGSEGSLSVPDMALWKHQGPKSWWSPIEATVTPFTPSDPLLNQIEHFAEVVRGTALPLVSGQEGLRSLQVVEAIQTSVNTGESVQIAPL